MPSADERELARAEIVDAAEAVLNGELGVIAASRIIDWAGSIIDPDMEDKELLGFKSINSQSDHLTVGELLESWHVSVRDVKRREVAEFEALFEEGVMLDAAVLVERYRRVT